MKKWLTCPQFARKTGVCPETVRRAAARGDIHAIRTPGGQLRIPSSEVERVLGTGASIPTTTVNKRHI